MAKAPPNLPAKGDRCYLRGRYKLGVGIVYSLNPENNWTVVDWLEAKNQPKIVHLYELEKANDTSDDTS